MVFEQHIPAGWQEAFLGTVADVIDPHPSHRAPEEVEDGVPFAGIGDLSERGELVNPRVRRVSPQILKEHAARYSLSGNSIGFGRVATIGKVIDFSDDASGIAISPTMAVIEPRAIHRDYLVQALRSLYVRKEIDRLLTGTTRSSLGIELLRELHIPIPPDGVPGLIGEILSTVDEAIEHTEKLIAKHQQIKAGLMHDLFTRGLTPDGHLRPPHTEAPYLYKDSPLGPIPIGWNVQSIDHLFRRRMEKGIEGLPIMAITMDRGLVARDEVERRVISNLGPEDHLLLREGDIAYNMMRLWQGVLGRAKQDGLVSPAYVVLTPNPEIDSAFAEYLFSRPSSVSRFKAFSQGIVNDRLRLYFRDLKRLQFSLQQNVKEQREIVERVASQDSHLAAEKIYLGELFEVRSGLMHDLLTGKTEVQIDPEEELA